MAPGEAAPPPIEHAEGKLRARILGPLRVWRDGHEVDTGPPQQALLLAILLARVDTIVSASEIVDLMWAEESPRSAVNTLHKYVGAVRRMLEPEVGTRHEGSFIHRRGLGYLCSFAPDILDLAAFRSLLRRANTDLAHRRYERAFEGYAAALALWTGPAGGGMGERSGVAAVFAALNAEYVDTCTVAADLAARVNQHARMIAPLRLAVSMDPLNEPVLAALVHALGAAGQQSAALSVFRTARARLADELGLDPGPVLAAAHRRVLHGAAPTVDAEHSWRLLASYAPIPARPSGNGERKEDKTMDDLDLDAMADGIRTPGSPAGSLTEGLAAGVPDRGIGLAFGESRSVNGLELVPVAFVSYGFGGAEDSPQLGTGGGGGGVAIPLGAYVSRGTKLVFRPNTIILLAAVIPVVKVLGLAVVKLITARGRRDS